MELVSSGFRSKRIQASDYKDKDVDYQVIVIVEGRYESIFKHRMHLSL